MYADIRADRCRMLILPLLSRARPVAGRGPLQQLSVAAAVSRDRLWKLSRNMVQPTAEEAERIARGASGILRLPEVRLVEFLESGDEEVRAALRDMAPLPHQCTHCGTLPGHHSPLVRPYAVHEACLPALSDGAQHRWLNEVELCMDDAPGVIWRAWKAERTGDAIVNLFSLATRAGMEYRCFRRAWILAGLPRRRVPRERPEPLSRRVRLAWTTQVEQALGTAPESLQLLWQRARDAGVRLNLEQLAEFARMPQWQFRKRWIEAGLPTPKQTAALMGEEAPAAHR